MSRPNIETHAIPAVLPATMEALILESPGHLRHGEAEVPTPGPGELLVRVEAATTCGTDLKAYLRGHPQIPMPGVLGHEYSGVVVATGAGARFQPGDPVMGVHSAPCKQCFWCKKGQENLCESIMSTKVLGSYAQYLLIPERIARLNVFHKPAELSFGMASLLEPLSCVAQGMDLLAVQPDDQVLVIGPGAIGLMFVAALRTMGVESVTLAGRNRSRLEVGERLGAMPTLFDDVSLPAGRGFDKVIECTGNVEVWERSLDYSRRGGTIMLFGGCPSGTAASFDTKRLHYDQISLVSPFHFGTKAVSQARVWLVDHRMDLSPLLSGQRSLAEGQATFDDLQKGVGLKYVFTPNA